MTTAPAGMAWIPPGTFTMGSDAHYPEESPAHLVQVDGFWIDRHPVTNEQFAAFVDATGHLTVAERPLPAPPATSPAGGAVFVPPACPVALDDPSRWWSLVAGADWRHPLGPDSSIDGLDAHPVVQVAYEDAAAYAAWAGRTLPTEAQWEHAARGGLEGAEFAWGVAAPSAAEPLANVWSGAFPWRHDGGGAHTTPVGSFPGNGYGLLDVTGNVWEWTTDYFRPTHAPGLAGLGAAHSCCPSSNPTGPRTPSTDPRAPGVALRVVKGGSYLCSVDYCFRYRPSARTPQAVDSCTCHLGFRCVVPAHG